MLGVQIVTGIVLAMHYTPEAALAFDSVEPIKRDVNGGRLIQAVHAAGASMFFFAVYIHIFRGLYFGSYKAPREVLWILGVIIFLLMMATAFMGYVLPWGQMSFWAAAVITNIFAAIPIVGDPILQLLRGGFAVDNPTLNRFFSLHYLLPFIIAAVVALHIWALHVPGNNNPIGVEVKESRDTVPFHPYYTMKDFFAVVVFCIPFAWFVFFAPDILGAPRQLHHGQPAGDAAAHRAGMVLPAVLRDPARHRLQLHHRQQAARRHRLRRLDPDPVLRAVARYLQGALGHVPADVQVVLLAVRHQLPAADVVRRAGAGAKVHSGRSRSPTRRSSRWSTTSSTSSSSCRCSDGSRSRGRCPIRSRSGAQAPGSGHDVTLQDRTRMIKITTIFAAALIGLGLTGAPAMAQEEATPIVKQHWVFAGPFGTFDQNQLQRGFQVFKEVCSNCHSAHLLAFRNLAEVGGPHFSEAQVKALAATYEIPDPTADGGKRPGLASDHWPSPFATEKDARDANGGALPPDMSVLAKARSTEDAFPNWLFNYFTAYAEGGPDYIHALLNGYEETPPAGFELPEGKYYNKVFPGHCDRHAAAAGGRADHLCGRSRRLDRTADSRPVFQGRLGLSDVGRRAAPRRQQGSGLPRADLPAAVRGADVAGQAARVAQRRALRPGWIELERALRRPFCLIAPRSFLISADCKLR